VVDRQPEKLLTPLNKLKGKGLRKYRPKDETGDAPHGDGGTANERLNQEPSSPLENEQSQELATPTAVSTGSVQADPRQNAVVVRDREEKMPYYAQIIDLLDAPVNLVEIRATIIDIDSDDFQEIGVQWEFFSSKDDGEKGYKGGLNTGETLFSRKEGQTMAQGLQLPPGNGLNLATIIGDASEYFLAKVNALEEKGKAKILSRPSVLTTNNIEAQLEHSQTHYVPLTGEREVDLYDIRAGVMLRVTPHIIEENDRELVKLAIQIEDGELTGAMSGDIPMVTQSVINTQAVVGQKESLLIGGYKKERNENKRQGLPCLGDVPFFGWLFKKNSVYSQEHERIFLITPTIVPYGTSNSKTGRIEKITETVVAPEKIKANGLTNLKPKATETSAPLLQTPPPE
jgi:type III secretion protein C